MCSGLVKFPQLGEGQSVYLLPNQAEVIHHFPFFNSSPPSPSLRILQQHLTPLLPHQKRRQHRKRPHHPRKHTPIHHPQPLRPLHPQPRIHHLSNRARPRRMVPKHPIPHPLLIRLPTTPPIPILHTRGLHPPHRPRLPLNPRENPPRPRRRVRESPEISLRPLGEKLKIHVGRVQRIRAAQPHRPGARTLRVQLHHGQGHRPGGFRGDGGGVGFGGPEALGLVVLVLR